MGYERCGERGVARGDMIHERRCERRDEGCGVWGEGENRKVESMTNATAEKAFPQAKIIKVIGKQLHVLKRSSCIIEVSTIP